MGFGRSGVVLTLGLIWAGGIAGAQETGLTACQTSINGEAHGFVYDAGSAALRENQSLRERLYGARGQITCPGLVTLRALTPELTDTERAPFCLQWDGKADTYIGYDLGERDAFLTCRTARKAFCQRVNRSKAAAAAWAGVAQDLAVDAGTETVQHAAGLVSVRGPAMLIGEKLVGLGAVAVQGVGAGAAIGAVAVTAVAAGGAIYICSDDGVGPAALQPAPGLRPGEVAPGADLPEGAAPLIGPTPAP